MDAEVTGDTQLTFGDFGVGSATAVLFSAATWWLLASAAPESPPPSMAVVVSIAPAHGGGRTEAAGGRASPSDASAGEDSASPKRRSPANQRRQSSKRGRPDASTPSTSTPEAPSPEGEGGEPGTAVSGSGEGGGEPSSDAETIATYRAELLGWLSGRFVVERSGLEADVLAALKIRASVAIADDGTVSGFSITSPSGHEVVDQAVRDALDPLVGRAVPAPPPGYPGTLPPTLTVTFVCSKSRCS